MATQCFLLDDTTLVADYFNNGNNDLNLAGNQAAWEGETHRIGTSRGSGVVNTGKSTVAGTTAGLEFNNTANLQWVSDPIDADVTISGSITFNLWGTESSMSANAGFQVVIFRVDSTTGALTQIINSERGTELGTSNAANNWSATPTSTACNKGDRLIIRPAINDAGGTMASTHVATLYLDGTTAAASGDTYVTFTETFGFQTTTPTGTTLYPTTTASDIDPGGAGTDTYEMWTSRGSGATSGVVDLTNGFISATQWTASAGGNVLEWYTKQLTAFTLSGVALVNTRALEALSGDRATIRAEIAKTDSTGGSVVVWGINGRSTDMGTTEADRLYWISGDDLALSNGDRLRLRVYLDDLQGSAVVDSTGTSTASFFYAGTSGGASGDSYATLQQSITEYVPGGATEDPFPHFGGGYYPTEG